MTMNLREAQQTMDAYLDGGEDAASFEAMCRLMRDDPEAARELALRSMLHHEIRRQIVRRQPERRGGTPRMHRRRIWIGAAAAVVLIAVMLAFMSMNGTMPTNSTAARPVAVLTDVINASWASEPHVPGDEFSADTIGLAGGSIKLTFLDGSAVELTGPARLSIRGNAHAILEAGRLAADARSGFTIDAPGGVRIVDLGTRFNVLIDETRRVHIDVTEGMVKVSLHGEGVSGEKLLAATMGVIVDPTTGFVWRDGGGSTPMVSADGELVIPSADADGAVYALPSGQLGAFSNADLIVGSATGPADYSGILFFQLPDRDGGAIRDATLNLTVQSAGRLEHANIDLWGLGYVRGRPALSGDWRLNADADARHLLNDAPPVRIIDNLIPAGQAAAIGQMVAVIDRHQPALAQYLNDLYDKHGAEAGDFVVLRLNADAPVAAEFDGSPDHPFANIRFAGSHRTDPDRRATLTLRLQADSKPSPKERQQ